MKLGVLLPTFRPSADDALERAARARDAGVEGVFAFDHLWPMGSPERPSLAPFPVLAAVAARFATLVVGPLVARVGVVATATLVEQLATLEAIAPGRLIAAIGTGDRLSEAEMLAYDRGGLSATQRRTLLGDALRALVPLTTVWCGAGGRATNELARELGVTLNVWDVAPSVVRDESARGPVTWAGPLGEQPAVTLDALAEAGATWAVAAAPYDLAVLEEWRARQ